LSGRLVLSNLRNLRKGAFVAKLLYSPSMNDVLLSRAERAIEASRVLRAQHRAVADQLENAKREVRRVVMESAMLRAELKALRDDREEQPAQHLVPPE
jgi:hypothetical protein